VRTNEGRAEGRKEGREGRREGRREAHQDMEMSFGEDGEARISLKTMEREEERGEAASPEEDDTLASLLQLCPPAPSPSSPPPSILFTHPKTASLTLPLAFTLCPPFSNFIRISDTGKKKEEGGRSGEEGGGMEVEGEENLGKSREKIPKNTPEEKKTPGIPIELFASFFLFTEVSDFMKQQSAQQMIFLESRDTCYIFGETTRGEGVQIKIKKEEEGDS
jgi:hypothetical protein